MVRFKVVSLFILSAIGFWIVSWIVAMVYYTTTRHRNLFDQIIDAIIVMVGMMWVYLFVLAASAVTGIFIAKSRNKPDVARGFQYCFVLVVILLVVFYLYMADFGK